MHFPGLDEHCEVKQYEQSIHPEETLPLKNEDTHVTVRVVIVSLGEVKDPVFLNW